MDTKTYPTEEVAELFGTTAEQLRNWRRLPDDHPRHLAASCVDGRYRYDAISILEWMNRPENTTFREVVIASFVNPVIRDWFERPVLPQALAHQTTSQLVERLRLQPDQTAIIEQTIEQPIEQPTPPKENP